MFRNTKQSTAVSCIFTARIPLIIVLCRVGKNLNYCNSCCCHCHCRRRYCCYTFTKVYVQGDKECCGKIQTCWIILDGGDFSNVIYVSTFVRAVLIYALGNYLIAKYLTVLSVVCECELLIDYAYFQKLTFMCRGERQHCLHFSTESKECAPVAHARCIVVHFCVIARNQM